MGAVASYRRLLEACNRVFAFGYRPFDTAGAETSPNVIHVGPLRTPPDGTREWTRSLPDTAGLLIHE